MSCVVELNPSNNELTSMKIAPKVSKENSWTGRMVKWLHSTPGGHLTQGIGGLLGAAACGVAAVAVMVTAVKGVIFGAILVATIAFAPFGIVLIAASCALAVSNNFPLQAMNKCWDFAMGQFEQMKAQSLQ